MFSGSMIKLMFKTYGKIINESILQNNNESINDAETSTSFDKNMTKGEELY